MGERLIGIKVIACKLTEGRELGQVARRVDDRNRPSGEGWATGKEQVNSIRATVLLAPTRI